MYCRTGNVHDRKFSQISATDNSRAGNFREFFVSTGPQLENEPLFVKFGFSFCKNSVKAKDPYCIMVIFACMKNSRIRRNS